MNDKVNNIQDESLNNIKMEFPGITLIMSKLLGATDNIISWYPLNDVIDDLKCVRSLDYDSDTNCVPFAKTKLNSMNKYAKAISILDEMLDGYKLALENGLYNNMSLPPDVFIFYKLLKMIENNELNKKDVMILRNPENNLHPTMQVKLAKILWYIQEVCGLPIIITTNSTYILTTFIALVDVSDNEDIFKLYDVVKDDENTNSIDNIKCLDMTSSCSSVMDEIAKAYNMIDEIILSSASKKY